MSETQERVRGAATSPGGVDFSVARAMMVDDQVRPIEVNDPRIIKVMRSLPRELCVPEAERGFAYADRTLPLSADRYLLQPLLVARLVQAAALTAGTRVLVVGAGTGYLAALAAHLAAHVVALESERSLAAAGAAFTAEVAPDVVWRVGPLAEGASSDEPFDVILIEGAVREIPAFCAAQLSQNGRVVGMIWPEKGIASAFVAEPQRNESFDGPWALNLRFDAPAPLLPELLPKPAFSL